MFSLSDLMDNLAARCASQADNVYAWPVESVSVPCVVVGYPSGIVYDLAGGGQETVTLPVWYAVGKSPDAAARDALAVVISGSSSMKAALDGADLLYDVRVTTAEIAELVVAGVTYLAGKFTAEVYT